MKVEGLKQNMTQAVNYSVLRQQELNKCLRFATAERFTQHLARILLLFSH